MTSMPALLSPQLRASQSTRGARVCDRCIVKKIKCNQARPSCSRCLEDGLTCNYSFVKKKPGPGKNVRRRTSAVRPLQQSPAEPATPAQALFVSHGLADIAATLSTGEEIQDAFASLSAALPLHQPNLALSHPYLRLTYAEQYRLIVNFFDLVHPSIPLFRRGKFMEQLPQGTVRPSLVLALTILTARVLGVDCFTSQTEVDAYMKTLLELNDVDMDVPPHALSLDLFKEACLLVFYDFHQCPGERAWSRVGQLTRKAHWCGLHQIDSEAGCSIFDAQTLPTDQVDEWSSGTPFIVAAEDIKTALPMSSLSAVLSETSDPTNAKIYLPSETASLWRCVKQVIAACNDDEALNYRMHMITTAVLREAGTILRLWRQNPSKQLQARLEAFKHDISAMRLALLLRYLSVSRDILRGETDSAYHARLVCVLHIRMASLLAWLAAKDTGCTDEAWLTEGLEHCQHIVSVLKQWDGHYTTAVDPAICFIPFTALTVLETVACGGLSGGLDILAKMEPCKTVLLLFLQQFESFWQLPHFLLAESFAKITSLLHPTMGEIDFETITKIKPPLNNMWIALMTLPGYSQRPSPPGTSLQLAGLSEWDYHDWAAMTRADS